MPEYDDIELTDGEVELERTLTDLGPAMRRAARARSEAPDPTFLTALRARLVEPEAAAPDRSFQERLRVQLVGKQRAFPWRLGVAAGTAVAAVLVLLLVFQPFTQRAQRAPLAVGVPQPSAGDLTRGYPPPGIMGGGGGYLSPTVSLLQGPSGAFTGELHLTAGSLRAMPASLPVYRLTTHLFRGASLHQVAHRLGIGGKTACMSPTTGGQARCSGRTWSVVASALVPSRKPLHSVAVSPAGEVIYHDTSYDQATYRGSVLRPVRAIAIARSWLYGLGWPAARMPVLRATPARAAGPPGAGSPISVSFGWKEGVASTIPAATLWVAPTGRVIEALVWPAIAGHRVVATTNVGAAWTEVMAGKAPVAVEGVGVPAPGTGVASQADVVQVLVTPAHGPAYLEPAFRFSGTLRLATDQRTHHWYALVPAVARR
jgi:hypothetical protein